MTDIKAVIAAHRRVADLLEANLDLPAPVIWHDGVIVWNLYAYECPDGVPAMVARIRRLIGGQWDKREEQGYGEPEMVFEREGYRIKVRREAVCTRRVVRTETVVKPAISLPEHTETVEIVEWDCEPVLASEGAR